MGERFSPRHTHTHTYRHFQYGKSHRRLMRRKLKKGSRFTRPGRISRKPSCWFMMSPLQKFKRTARPNWNGLVYVIMLLHLKTSYSTFSEINERTREESLLASKSSHFELSARSFVLIFPYITTGARLLGHTKSGRNSAGIKACVRLLVGTCWTF